MSIWQLVPEWKLLPITHLPFPVIFIPLKFTEPVIPIGSFDLLPFIAFMLPAFSAIRLAKFNIDDTQKTSFRGIPAPGMAIFVASLPLALAQVGHLTDGSLRLGYCIGIVLIFSFMMVCNLRFFSFKMKNVKWKGNEVRFIFLALAIAGFVIFRFVALPFIMMAYILLSIFFGKQME